MTEQTDPERAAWSRPSGTEGGGYHVVAPAGPSVTAGGSGPRAGSTPIVRPSGPASGLITATADLGDPGGVPSTGSSMRGLFRRSDPVALGGGSTDGADRPRQLRLGWFLGAAGTLLGVGLVVVLVMAVGGSFGGDHKLSLGRSTPERQGPPLAQACPPPTATANPGYREGPPPPPGPRTVDTRAGISYKAYGSPWTAWHDDWVAGQLQVRYVTGQAFVTETYGGGEYLASILSGSVPATVNDGNILDLKCVGQQIVADVRGAYYPQPNQMDKIEDKQTTLGGLDAWVSIFRLHFNDRKDGLKATSELVGVVTIDVGKPTAAVLYVSIPGTHKQYDWVVKDVINSVRAAS
jgi:hypothetical protein